MWNDIKSNLSSARIYFIEFLLFNFSLIILIIFFIQKSSQIILSVLLLIFVSFIFFNFLGKKRRRGINQIQEIIENIRKNIFTESNEIKLNKSLTELEDEIKQMFEKAKSDINYLKRLEKMRTEFLANVSHELITPIFAIQGYVETLLDGAISDEKVNKNFLEKANQHTISLSNLLNDLIDISMIETGEMRMSFRYFNINDYIQSLVQEFIPMAEEKNIEFIYHPIREKLQLFGDKNKLRQVFVNLITNAIKYTEKGKVEILVEEESKFGKIIIRDTGIGIPDKDIDRIFERFYRVNKDRSRSVGGTGLGLAIVKHIIEAHGSKIEVKSELGKGSELSFKLKK